MAWNMRVGILSTSRPLTLTLTLTLTLALALTLTWNMRVGILSTSRPVARGGVTATATMSEESSIGAPICSRCTLASARHRKMATGHAPTFCRKVSVPESCFWTTGWFRRRGVGGGEGSMGAAVVPVSR